MTMKSGSGNSGKKGPSGRSYRNATGLTRQPKKMRGRKVSSQRWLTRQLNDPYVAEAKARGYRSRAAIKLEQIDDRYQLLKPGMAIIDLERNQAPPPSERFEIDSHRGAIIYFLSLLFSFSYLFCPWQ